MEFRDDLLGFNTDEDGVDDDDDDEKAVTPAFFVGSSTGKLIKARCNCCRKFNLISI